ncbi:MAG: hypothetical protein ACOCWA_01785, partial [Bacteroidota bacterium]
MMDADQIEILGTLRGRVKKLMASLSEVKERNMKLESELLSLKVKNDQQEKIITELEHKYNNLKLAKVL